MIVPEEPNSNGIFQVIRNTYYQWKELLTSSRSLSDLVMLNLSYWLAIGGTQMTLLPILMVDANSFNLGESIFVSQVTG